jgi:hypothetical protein
MVMGRILAIATAALAVLGLAVAGAGAAPAAGQMITITNVSVSPDRHVTVDWTGPPNGIEFGSLQIATKPDAGTDGNFFSENVVEYDLLTKGQKHWVGTDPLQAAGTYYARVTGWWDGYGPGDYTNYGVVYSQVVPFDAAPICQKVLVTPGHYVKKVVRKAHWVKRNGKRVWVKAVYKKVWVKPVYREDCH